MQPNSYYEEDRKGKNFVQSAKLSTDMNFVERKKLGKNFVLSCMSIYFI